MEILQLNNILRELCLITNLPITVWDTEYRVNMVFEPFDQSKASEQSFCRYIRDCGKFEHCGRSDMYGLQQAAATKKLVSYRCPLGLIELVAPVCREDQIIGYIMMGQSVINEPMQEQKVLNLLHSLYSEITPSELQSYLSRLRCIPHLTPRQLDSYIALLKIIVGYIEGNDLLSFPQKTLGQLAKDYIRQNYAKKITLAELSMYLHCSTVTLTEHFRREFGTTVVTYLNQKRLERAEKLLVYSDISITEIAEQCGFSDANYFFVQFKKKHNTSPAAYRKQRREGKKQP